MNIMLARVQKKYPDNFSPQIPTWTTSEASSAHLDCFSLANIFAKKPQFQTPPNSKEPDVVLFSRASSEGFSRAGGKTDAQTQHPCSGHAFCRNGKCIAVDSTGALYPSCNDCHNVFHHAVLCVFSTRGLHTRKEVSVLGAPFIFLLTSHSKALLSVWPTQTTRKHKIICFVHDDFATDLCNCCDEKFVRWVFSRLSVLPVQRPEKGRVDLRVGDCWLKRVDDT